MEVGKYSFYVGTSTGTLLYTHDKLSNAKAATPEEASKVTALTFGRTNDDIFVGYENGNVSIYDTLDGKYLKTFTQLEGEGRIVGIGCLDKVFVFGKQDGIINVWDGRNENFFDMELDERSTLDCLAHNNNRPNIIATGGEFNDFKLWDVETHQCVFKAKSMGHDKLNLPIPTSVRAITFFPESEHLSGCATKEGHVLLYDDRAQRRPVVKYLQEKASFTTISCAHRERQCLVGTTRGFMQLLDMKAGKCLKTFTTFMGSVTGIYCDPSEPYVATTSLDRFLRIHNLETKELLLKAYMKLNLTKLLMKPVIKDEPLEEEELGDENVDDEYENIFSTMETVTSDRKTKKMKRATEGLDAPEQQKRKKKKTTTHAIDS
ncbi:hypothetical protein NQ318_018964 [Aromia moschata]|uniref:WD repeat-containing protein 74 n=1 Tax=Aromia moschata TaxID=1265417 RepID=A0AAV8ZGE2_9CUCU|nr:hypothetical protein NQ318_018964 [Aromia moschata]